MPSYFDVKMPSKRQRLHIDPYYCPPMSDGHDLNSPLSSPSPSFSFSPPTDVSSMASRTPLSASPEWRMCFALCLYDFSSSDPDHLPFQKNELLEIVKKEQSGWWAALRDDRIGWVPSAFVVELSDEDAEKLRDVREELRVYEFEAERLYSTPITSHFFDTIISPVLGHEHGHEYHDDYNWVPIVDPGGKMPFMQLMAPSGLVTDFPDDVAPLSGVSLSPHLHPYADPLDTYSTDPEPSSTPNRLAQPIACPASPVTPMPQPSQPTIAALLINKPTPPTPLSSPSSRRSHFNRSRSDSAPSPNRSVRRRPIMVNDFSSLSRISMLLDSPQSDDAITVAEELQTAYESVRTSPVVRLSDKVRRLTGDDDAQAFHNAKVAQASLPWYLKPTYSSNEIKLEYDGSVRAGAISALVERLTVDPLKMTQEQMYRNAFITTFSTFTTAREFFNLLVERYEMEYPSSLTQSESDEWREKKLRPVQKRVLSILSIWLENGLLQDDPHIAPRLKDFLSVIVSPPTLALSAKLLLQSLDKMMTTVAQLPVANAAPTTPSKWRRTHRTHKNDLLRFEPADVAAQLTLYEYRLYAKIRPRECLLWAKTQVGESVANLATFCTTNDRVAAWVKGSILTNEGLGKRANMVDIWIKIAEKCRLLNNFSTMSAIVAALSSADLTRLHLTWAHVGRRSQLDALERLNAPSGNFSEYRNTLQSIEGSCVPFIGIFLTDIVHIQDQLKDNVSFRLSPPGPGISSNAPPACSSLTSPTPSSSTSVSSSSTSICSTSSSGPEDLVPMGPPLVNFVKRYKWADAVRSIMRFQGKVPAITENAPLLALVAEQIALAAEKLKDPSAFWVRSQELQQSEVTHSDIRRGLEAAGF